MILVMYSFAAIHAVIAMNFALSGFINHCGSEAIISFFSAQPRWYVALGVSVVIVIIFIGDCVYVRLLFFFRIIKLK